MAFVHGKNTKVLLRETDLTSFLQDSSMSSNMDMAETSVYGNTNKTYIQGLADSTLTLAGLFDGDEDAVDEVLNGLIGDSADVPISIGPNGLALGERVFTMTAQESAYEVVSSIGDVVKVSAEFQPRQPTGRTGVSLHDLTEETATADGSSHDGTASTDNGGYAQIHVTAAAGTTLDVTIEHSADDASWATLATFAQLTGVGYEHVAVAAGTTVNRYLRASWTVAGGGFTFSTNFTRNPSTS